MTSTGQSVVLCMIVKNERHVLQRCLRSVLPLIDRWLIVDTGSTDGTQALIREVLHAVPGELMERPWLNFGHNRSEAVALARPMADYLLTLDADEYLRVDADFRWPALLHDAYTLPVDSGGVLYARIQMVRCALPWRYEGVLHEYITADMPHTQAAMEGVTTVRLLEGARSRDPLTYRRDAGVLEDALRGDPDNARYVFYLAQSYRDAHEPALALCRYRQRAAMDGFTEEVWCSLYEAAKLMYTMGADWPAVQEAFLDAYRYRPTRAEPLYRIGVWYVQHGQHDAAMRYLDQAMQLQQPSGETLFVEADVYRFLLPLEYAVACFWLGRHAEAVAVTDRLLADDGLSDERRALLLRNRQFSIEQMAGESSA